MASKKPKEFIRGSKQVSDGAHPLVGIIMGSGSDWDTMKFASKKVIIAGAGGAAHLPGMTASKTVLPVLGVPVESRALKGLDSLLSIAQMPAGIPVGTLAIGRSGAVNAALLAASILGAKHRVIREAFRKFRAEQTGRVLANPDPSAAPPAVKKKGKHA